MNRSITLSQAIEGYLLDARARRLSPRTITGYHRSLRRLETFLETDPPLSEITHGDIREFLNYMGETTIPSGGVSPGRPITLSKRTIKNIHTGLSALWTWAVKEGIVDAHVVRAVKPPRPEEPAIEPFTREEVEAILAACERSDPYTRPGKAECSNARETAVRDRAIILLLVDSGIRVGELADNPRYKSEGLRIHDLNRRTNSVRVFGKRDKERFVRVSHRTMKSIWRYLTSRPDAVPEEPLFLNRFGAPITTSGVWQLIKSLGESANVPNAHPHRFRHTFATNFLRNGGTPLELQEMMGHTTLEMVRKYVKIAQVDLDKAHRRASPVANWNL